MDEKHLWNAIRYVEHNPVRSGLITDACAYRWSSAAAHLSGKDRTHLLDMVFWGQSGGVERWTDLLAGSIGEAEMKRLRQATYSGKPLGTEEFVARAKVIGQAQTLEGSVRKMPVQDAGWLATPGAALWH